jgi:CheY-like chemotaxis protein
MSPAPIARRAPRRASPGDGYVPVVLVVDDHEDMRELYAECFRRAGFRVECAVDGEHALFKVLNLVPDLVVMDLAMPVLDGWEATRTIKTHARTKHIPVLVLTARSEHDELHRADEAGADAVLVKPCEPDALLDVAHDLLER